jgi:Protein of unknown function (DUF2917)
MKFLHQKSQSQSLGAVQRLLRIDGATRLIARRAGWLTVQAGRVWLTFDGGGHDHVIDAGHAMWVGLRQGVVVEPWQWGDSARFAWAAAAPERALWQRRAQRLLRLAFRAGPAWALCRAARGLRAAADALAAWARSAEASAKRSQGCIAAGESIAASGALQ